MNDILNKTGQDIVLKPVESRNWAFGDLFEIEFTPESGFAKLLEKCRAVDNIVRQKLGIKEDYPSPGYYLVDDAGINIIRGMDPEDASFYVPATSNPASFSVFINTDAFKDDGESIEEVLNSDSFNAMIVEEITHVYSMKRVNKGEQDEVHLGLSKDSVAIIPSDWVYINPQANKLLLLKAQQTASNRRKFDLRYDMPLESFLIEAYTSILKSAILPYIKTLEEGKHLWAFGVDKSQDEFAYLEFKDLMIILDVSVERVLINKIFQFLKGDIVFINDFIKTLQKKRSKERYKSYWPLIEGLIKLLEITKKSVNNELAKEDLVELSKFNYGFGIKNMTYTFEDKRALRAYTTQVLNMVDGKDLLPSEES